MIWGYLYLWTPPYDNYNDGVNHELWVYSWYNQLDCSYLLEYMGLFINISHGPWGEI